MKATAEEAQGRAARIAGFMYLLTLATAVFAAFYVRSGLFVRGNPTKTAENIMANEQLYRVSILSDLVAFAGVVLLIVALYVLLKPVNRNLALLAAFWRLVETAMLCVIALGGLVVLLLLSGVDHPGAFETDQLHALAMLATSVQGSAYIVSFPFLGLGSTVFSYLLLTSNYVPRALAAWGIFSSLLVLLCTLAIVVFPGFAETAFPACFAPIFVYEVTLGLWLLIKGANIQPSANAAGLAGGGYAP